MQALNSALIRIVDLSAVQACDGEEQVRALAACARQYRCGVITALPAWTPLAISLILDIPDVTVSGNVGFPSGGQTTTIKVREAEELVRMGCREIDMVANIGRMVSGDYSLVQEDIRAVVEASGACPVKAILECQYLSDSQIRRGCDLAIAAGARFVKTGTGWTSVGVTVEVVRLIKAHVGDAVLIKASGGIRSLQQAVGLVEAGANRLGIGLRWASAIFDACLERAGAPNQG